MGLLRARTVFEGDGSWGVVSELVGLHLVIEPITIKVGEDDCLVSGGHGVDDWVGFMSSDSSDSSCFRNHDGSCE